MIRDGWKFAEPVTMPTITSNPPRLHSDPALQQPVCLWSHSNDPRLALQILESFRPSFLQTQRLSWIQNVTLQTFLCPFIHTSTALYCQQVLPALKVPPTSKARAAPSHSHERWEENKEQQNPSPNPSLPHNIFYQLGHTHFTRIHHQSKDGRAEVTMWEPTCRRLTGPTTSIGLFSLDRR